MTTGLPALLSFTFQLKFSGPVQEQVVLQSRIGGKHVVNMPVGEQLPRICQQQFILSLQYERKGKKTGACYFCNQT